MQSTKTEAARELATNHSTFDPDVVEIVRIDAQAREERPGEPIKLLEVNATSVPAGVVPIYFGPTKQTPFPSIIVAVTPEEFERIQSKELPLPDGWRLGDRLFKRKRKKTG